MKAFVLISAVILLYSGHSAAEDGIQWIVKTSSGDPCLMAQMDIKANFTYNTTDAKVKNILYEIPNNSTSVNLEQSSCDKTESHVVVGWGNGNNFTINFLMSNSSYDLSVFKVSLNVSDLFKDASDNSTIDISYKRVNESFFETPANFSFHCTREQVLNDTANSGFLVLSKVQFEAFKSDKSSKFSLAKDCENNHFKPDIVPIAVGLSLIALIIIVLIAYIVGRRRQQARGYLNIM